MKSKTNIELISGMKTKWFKLNITFSIFISIQFGVRYLNTV